MDAVTRLKLFKVRVWPWSTRMSNRLTTRTKQGEVWTIDQRRRSGKRRKLRAKSSSALILKTPSTKCPLLITSKSMHVNSKTRAKSSTITVAPMLARTTWAPPRNCSKHQSSLTRYLKLVAMDWVTQGPRWIRKRSQWFRPKSWMAHSIFTSKGQKPQLMTNVLRRSLMMKVSRQKKMIRLA